MARFLVVPQWQGSSAPRAMSLADGATAIAEDLPPAATTQLDVPLEAGDALGSGVQRLSSLQRVADAIRAELDAQPELTVVIGGDSGVAIPAVQVAGARNPGMALVWCSARPGLHRPDPAAPAPSSTLTVRAITGAVPELMPTHDALPPERVCLVAARDLSPAEREYVDSTQTSLVGAIDLDDEDALAAAVGAADAVYVHVDLDVLDPAVISEVPSPVPFGVAVPTLIAAIKRLRENVPLAGASLAGFAPRSADAAAEDRGTILRLIGALT